MVAQVITVTRCMCLAADFQSKSDVVGFLGGNKYYFKNCNFLLTTSNNIRIKRIMILAIKKYNIYFIEWGLSRYQSF